MMRWASNCARCSPRRASDVQEELRKHGLSVEDDLDWLRDDAAEPWAARMRIFILPSWFKCVPKRVWFFLREERKPSVRRGLVPSCAGGQLLSLYAPQLTGSQRYWIPHYDVFHTRELAERDLALRLLALD